MTNTPERKYKDSAEAYIAVHAALTWAVECHLENCEYENACKYAAMMREIERHTDV